MSLLLTLIFLSLGIACLTVLYMIVKRGHRAAGQHVSKRSGRGQSSRPCASITYIINYWVRLASYKKNKLVEDEFSDDEV